MIYNMIRKRAFVVGLSYGYFTSFETTPASYSDSVIRWWYAMMDHGMSFRICPFHHQFFRSSIQHFGSRLVCDTYHAHPLNFSWRLEARDTIA